MAAYPKLFQKDLQLHKFFYYLLIAFCCSSKTFAGGEPDSFNLTEVAQDIYLHQGVHVNFEDPLHDDIANIGFILGKKCIAVIDTGGSLKIGNELYDSIRKISDLPICFVINTHIHFDHVLGNKAFDLDETEFVGHKNLTEAIEGNRGFFLQQFTDDLGPNPTENSIIGPTMTVTDALEVDLGDRVLLLTAHQTAHTNTDLTVFDKQTQTLWTGDLLFRERIPAFDGSLKGWLSVLEKMSEYDVALVIPGHGSPSTGWPEALSKEKEYLKVLLNDTRQAIAKGLFMDEVIETVGSNEKQNWLLYQQHHKRNVSKAFIELVWE